MKQTPMLLGMYIHQSSLFKLKFKYINKSLLSWNGKIIYGLKIWELICYDVLLKNFNKSWRVLSINSLL